MARTPGDPYGIHCTVYGVDTRDLLMMKLVLL